MLDLSVIIVTYNSRAFLKGCLESLRKASAGYAVEIIVVDNASTDGTAEWLRKEHPEVRVLVNQENLGFARANNQAFSICQPSRWLLLLNPDTLLSEDALCLLIRAGEAHPEAGALGPLLLNQDGSVQRSYRSFPSVAGEALHALFLDRLPPFSRRYGLQHCDYWRVRQVDWLSGACLLLPRSVADQVGLFDPRFFMYSEDMDLCYRIHRLDRQIVLVPEARVVHFGGRSTGQRRLEMLYELFRSKYLFMEIHFGPGAARWFRRWSILGLAARWALWSCLSLFRKGSEARAKAKEIKAVLQWHLRPEGRWLAP